MPKYSITTRNANGSSFLKKLPAHRPTSKSEPKHDRHHHPLALADSRPDLELPDGRDRVRGPLRHCVRGGRGGALLVQRTRRGSGDLAIARRDSALCVLLAGAHDSRLPAEPDV